jgi:uncharacterized protein (TIGR02996 family)
MIEDEPFLRTLLANPDDRVSRLVYADWLDERADPRAEYLRIDARLAELSPCHESRAGLSERKRELQASLPRWWLALVGGVRATSTEPDPVFVDVAALAIGRTPKYTDYQGYEMTIEAAAPCLRTGAVAYLESRSKWLGDAHDITYYLRLRDFAGRATSWEPETYNPYFGCAAQFMEWFGDAVIFVYREKHHTYLARFGFDSRPNFQAIGDDWILNGREIGYWHWEWHGTSVHRLSIPDLEPLSPLSEAEATTRDLLPG